MQGRITDLLLTRRERLDCCQQALVPISNLLVGHGGFPDVVEGLQEGRNSVSFPDG